MSRPNYRIADLTNGAIKLRYCLIPGRPLGDYVLPYWPVRSFISLVKEPAEVCLRVEASHASGEGRKILHLRRGRREDGHRLSLEPRSWDCFDIYRGTDQVVLKVTNEGSDSPLAIEQYFSMTPDRPGVTVYSRSENISDRALPDLTVSSLYRQDFNWGPFGSSGGGAYLDIAPDSEGESRDFYAFSRGMKRGYEFTSASGCEIHYRLLAQRNGWEVGIAGPASDLEPGEALEYRYGVRCLEAPPEKPSELDWGDFDPANLAFERDCPSEYRVPSFDHKPRAMNRVFQNLPSPKVRGLNLRGSFPGALDDLKTLSDWGCNLLITSLGEPGETRQIVGRAHQLGMEVLVQGRGGFSQEPDFGPLKVLELDQSEMPDAFGQDEDHYYWHPDRPLLDFEDVFGKGMSEASQAERTRYWSRCFTEKWRRVLDDVSSISPDAGVWFYTPSPGMAHVDPLDYYDIFMEEVGAIDQHLTVFPFYYGVESSQVEYMVRRWKDAGLSRVVFLPMRDFMTHPSQYFRAITAARRAGADGTCGFSFSVGESEPGDEWQWKSVMLAAQANFPTPELDAYVRIEDPARLVDALARRKAVVSGEGREDASRKLDELIPRGAECHAGEVAADDETLPVLIGGEGVLRDTGSGKGVLEMRGESLLVGSPDDMGRDSGLKLLLRFADLAQAEALAGRI
jgi:hypothetical protein